MAVDTVGATSRPQQLGKPSFRRAARASSSLLELLDSPSPLDGDAIGAFLQLGFFLDDATPFEEIRYSGPPLPPPPQPFAGSPEEACDAIDDALRSLLARLAAPPEVHLLSGGRDSRHLLFALDAVGRAPRRCLTIAPSRLDPDWIAADRVTDALGLAHELVEPRRASRTYLIAHASATELCADEHHWLMPLAERLRECRGPVVDGMLSDVFLNTAGTPEGGSVVGEGFLGRRAWRLDGARDALERNDLAALAPAAIALGVPIPPEAIALAERILGIRIADRESVERRVAKSFVALEAEPNPVAAWVAAHRGRRETLLFPRGMCRSTEMVTPFGDGELLALVRSMPWRWIFDRPFHDELVARRYPDMPRLPFAESAYAGPRRRRPASMRSVLGWIGSRLDERTLFTAAERRMLERFEALAGRGRARWLRALASTVRSDDRRRLSVRLDESILGRRTPTGSGDRDPTRFVAAPSLDP